MDRESHHGTSGSSVVSLCLLSEHEDNTPYQYSRRVGVARSHPPHAGLGVGHAVALLVEVYEVLHMREIVFRSRFCAVQRDIVPDAGALDDGTAIGGNDSLD